MHDEVDDVDDHYIDGIDSSNSRMEDYDDFGHGKEDILDDTKSHDENLKESSTFFNAKTNDNNIFKEVREESTSFSEAS